MKRFPSNLSANDQRTYRRWTGGLYLSYLVVIVVAIVLTLTNRPANELNASNEIQLARLKASSGPFADPAATRPGAKP
jgi:hypothetical protein